MDKCQNTIHHLPPLLVGILGSLFLSLFYFLTLFLVTKDLRHPFEQFLLNKYWLSALILGFGLQMGLFQEVRMGNHPSTAQSKMAVGAGTGLSSTAMVACCAHHLTDVLPLLGVSAASIFLAKYQTQFLALGVLANLAGIFLMARVLFKRRLKWSLKFL